MASAIAHYGLKQGRGARVTKHFQYTEKEYRQKRSQLFLAIFFCGLAVAMAIVGALAVETLSVRVAFVVAAVLIVLRLLNTDVLVKSRVFIEVEDRRDLIRQLYMLADEFCDASRDGRIEFAETSWSLRRLSEDVIHLQLPTGAYNLTLFGVEDVGDGHIDRAEVDQANRELKLRLEYIRAGNELKSRPDPITGSLATQPSGEIFRH